MVIIEDMTTKKLKSIFGFSILLFIAHGLEEYFNNFYSIDPQVAFMFKPFLSLASYQTSFLIFQILLWALLVIIFFSIKTLPRWIAIIFGIIYVYETYHIIKAIEVGGYYPGLITALAFPVIAFLYWRQLIKSFSRNI